MISWKCTTVWQKTDGHCLYCGLHRKEIIALYPDRPENDLLTMDHVIPRSQGGPSGVYNMLPACKYCNSLRSSKWPAWRNCQPRFKQLAVDTEKAARERMGQRHIPGRKRKPIGEFKSHRCRKAPDSNRKKNRIQELRAEWSPELITAFQKLKAIS